MAVVTPEASGEQQHAEGDQGRWNVDQADAREQQQGADGGDVVGDGHTTSVALFETEKRLLNQSPHQW